MEKRRNISKKEKKNYKNKKNWKFKEKKKKKIPNGYKILSEQEKQKRINDLNSEKKELEEKLYKVPIARMSRQQEDLKKNIEKSLSEIDEKLNKLIGYKEVIVKEDE